MILTKGKKEEKYLNVFVCGFVYDFVYFYLFKVPTVFISEVCNRRVVLLYHLCSVFSSSIFDVVL